MKSDLISREIFLPPFIFEFVTCLLWLCAVVVVVVVLLLVVELVGKWWLTVVGEEVCKVQWGG